MLVCEVFGVHVCDANGNVSRLYHSWLIVSIALRTGRFAVSILAGTPSAFILSILIYGMWHHWRQDWSGNAPSVLGGNLSRIFCLLRLFALSAKRAEPHLQLSPLQPRIRRSSILYIVSQPVLRSTAAAFTASSVLPVNWRRRGEYFFHRCCTYTSTIPRGLWLKKKV